MHTQTPFVSISIGGTYYRDLLDSGTAGKLVSDALYRKLLILGVVKGIKHCISNCITAPNLPLHILGQIRLDFNLDNFSCA